MRIIRTILTFYPHVTGPANQAFEIASGLADRGHENFVITTTRNVNDVPRKEINDGVRIRRYRALGEDLPYGLAPGALGALLNSEPDVIHAHSYKNFLTDAGYLASRLKTVPFVLHGHGTFYGYRQIVDDGEPVRYRAYDLLTGKRPALGADAVVVSTEQEREEAIEFGIEESKIHVVPVGQRVETYEKIPKQPPEDRFRILLVGRLDPSRNVERAIEALALLPADVELRIVGGEGKRARASDGEYLMKLEALCERLGVSERVTFVGPKYDEDLVREYRSADLFVYPSRYENFGQTVLEAAAAGLPVVATPEGVARDIVTDGQTGYLIDADDAAEIADRVTDVRELGPEVLGASIQNRVRERYAWEQIRDRYLSIYRGLQ